MAFHSANPMVGRTGIEKSPTKLPAANKKLAQTVEQKEAAAKLKLKKQREAEEAAKAQAEAEAAAAAEQEEEEEAERERLEAEAKDAEEREKEEAAAAARIEAEAEAEAEEEAEAAAAAEEAAKAAAAAERARERARQAAARKKTDDASAAAAGAASANSLADGGAVDNRELFAQIAAGAVGKIVSNVVSHIASGEVKRQPLRYGWNDSPGDRTRHERAKTRTRYDRLIRLLNAEKDPERLRTELLKMKELERDAVSDGDSIIVKEIEQLRAVQAGSEKSKHFQALEKEKRRRQLEKEQQRIADAQASAELQANIAAARQEEMAEINRAREERRVDLLERRQRERIENEAKQREAESRITRLRADKQLLHDKLAERFEKSVVLPELEKRNKILSGISQQLRAPMDMAALKQHERLYTEIHDQKLKALTEARISKLTAIEKEQSTAPVYYKHPSAVAHEKAEEAAKQEKIKKSQLLKKQKTYAILVKEMYAPTADPAIHTRVETAKKTVKTHRIMDSYTQFPRDALIDPDDPKHNPKKIGAEYFNELKQKRAAAKEKEAEKAKAAAAAGGDDSDGAGGAAAAEKSKEPVNTKSKKKSGAGAGSAAAGRGGGGGGGGTGTDEDTAEDGAPPQTASKKIDYLAEMKQKRAARDKSPTRQLTSDELERKAAAIEAEVTKKEKQLKAAAAASASGGGSELSSDQVDTANEVSQMYIDAIRTRLKLLEKSVAAGHK